MKLIFTLTPGCTGTAYLTELIQWNIENAVVHHEILTYTGFGEDTPEISHLHTFNNSGNVPLIQQFWQRKLNKILAGGQPVYAETSHLLMKAGLVENIAEAAREHEIHFIVLKRDTLKVMQSYHNRGDFSNLYNLWGRYLDPHYVMNKVPFHGMPLFSFSLQAQAIQLWYLREIEQRILHYRFHFGDQPNIHFHMLDIDDLSNKDNVIKFFDKLGLHYKNIVIPPPQNTSKTVVEFDKQDKIKLITAIKKSGLYTKV